MSIEVRVVRVGDESIFAQVAEGAFDHAIDPDTVAAYLGTSEHHLVVAITGGQVVGQVTGVVHRHPHKRATELWVVELGVAHAYRRLGVARRMLDVMFTIGRRERCDEVRMAVAPDNEAAHDLYRERAWSEEPLVAYAFKL